MGFISRDEIFKFRVSQSNRSDVLYFVIFFSPDKDDTVWVNHCPMQYISVLIGGGVTPFYFLKLLQPHPSD